MTLYDFLNYFLSLGSKDLYGIVGSMNHYVEQVAQTTKLPALVFSAVGIVLGVLLGLFGYKLLKPFVTVVLSGIGFFAGVDFFLTYLWGKVSWMQLWFCYVVAAVPAVIFFIFAKKKPVGGVFALTFITGSIITSAYTDSRMLILTGGVLLALITGAAFRFTFVAVTGFLGALLSVVTLAQLLPTVAILQIQKGNLLSLAVLGGVFVFFILIQMLITRKSRKLLAD